MNSDFGQFLMKTKGEIGYMINTLDMYSCGINFCNLVVYTSVKATG